MGNRFALGFGLPYGVRGLRSELNNQITASWNESFKIQPEIALEETFIPVYVGEQDNTQGQLKHLLQYVASITPKTNVASILEGTDLESMGKELEKPTLLFTSKISGFERLYTNIASELSDILTIPEKTSFEVPLLPKLPEFNLDMSPYNTFSDIQLMNSISLYEEQGDQFSHVVSYILNGSLNPREELSTHSQFLSKYSRTNLTPPPQAPLPK